MTLQDAIEEVKRVTLRGGWNGWDIAGENREPKEVDHAIATILNAVVKGELK